jgi:hypothetical protein
MLADAASGSISDQQLRLFARSMAGTEVQPNETGQVEMCGSHALPGGVVSGTRAASIVAAQVPNCSFLQYASRKFRDIRPVVSIVRR